MHSENAAVSPHCRLVDGSPPLSPSGTPEVIEGPPVALQRHDDISSADSLAACVLGVGDGISDDVGQEDLASTPGLLVDQAWRGGHHWARVDSGERLVATVMESMMA